MNKLLIITLLLFSFNSFSQDTSRGSMYYTKGKKLSVWIDKKGEKHFGLISYVEYSMGHTFFYQEGKKGYTRLTPQNTKYFIYGIPNQRDVRGTRYVSFGNRFYKSLNNEKKIRLYKYFYPKKNTEGKIYTKPNGDIAGYYKFYVRIPGKIELTYFWSPSVKNFKKKVSKLLLDCPELSEKIKNEVKGYTYQKGEINLDLWMKVAKEYEACLVD